MATKKSDAVAVSLKPSEFVSAGLPNDVDVEVTECRVELFTYPGTDTEALTVRIQCKNLDSGDTFEQNLSAGTGFAPSDDGLSFVPTGSRAKLDKTSNFALFLASVVEQGFPEERIENDTSVFEGLQFHLLRQAPPKGARTGDIGGKDIVTCESIIKLPWEKKPAGKGAAGKGAAAASKGGGKGAAAKNGDDPIEGRAKEILAEIVAEGGKDGVEFSKMRNLGFKKLKTEPDIRTKALEFLTDAKWIEAAAEEAGLAFDGDTLAAG